MNVHKTVELTPQDLEVLLRVLGDEAAKLIETYGLLTHRSVHGYGNEKMSSAVSDMYLHAKDLQRRLRIVQSLETIQKAYEEHGKLRAIWVVRRIDNNQHLQDVKALVESLAEKYNWKKSERD